MSNRAREDLFRDFERWGFDERGWAPNTRHRYAQRVRRADEWLQGRGTSVVRASLADLRAYLFSTSPTARNRNNIRQALVAFGSFLVALGWSEVNQALGLPRLPEPDSIPKALGASEALRIAAAARRLPLMESVMVLLYLYTGLRKSEGRLLEWSHFESDLSWIRFAGKRGRVREMWISDEIRPVVRRWRQESNEPRWVFPSPRRPGQPVSETWVRHLISEVGEMAEVPGLHPHLLRHTFATELLETGSDIRDVQVALGHADIKTTTIYVSVRPARLRDAVERVHYRREGP